MLTCGYWLRKFGGDPSMAERSITVDGKPSQVIGVPQRFHFLDQDDPLPIPIAVGYVRAARGNGGTAPQEHSR